MAWWLNVGVEQGEIRTEAHHRSGSNNTNSGRYRQEYAALIAQAPNFLALKERDPAGCQHAVWMAERWSVLEGWLKSHEPKSLRWNHPTAVWRSFYGKGNKKSKPIDSLEELKRAYPELMAEHRDEIMAQLRNWLRRNYPEVREVESALEPPRVDLADLGLL